MTTIITYNEMKDLYGKFKQNPPEDKFYALYSEYKFMKSLIQLAKLNNMDKDLFEYRKIQEKTAEELRNMGYKVTIKD